MSGNFENKFGQLAARRGAEGERGVRKDGGGNKVNIGEKQRRRDAGRERKRVREGGAEEWKLRFPV